MVQGSVRHSWCGGCRGRVFRTGVCLHALYNCHQGTDRPYAAGHTYQRYISGWRRPLHPAKRGIYIRVASPPASRKARKTASAVSTSRMLPIWILPEGVMPEATICLLLISSASFATTSAQCIVSAMLPHFKMLVDALSDIKCLVSGQ